ncbi:MAG TPA: cytochrome c [Methylomirabilota bacterium]|jgi:mono/diheme cytochrome c family protein|nr:cytochrome c [Methylomirabilota bacterium]
MKTLVLAVAVSASFFVFATASAQTPPADSGLLANSVYVKDCAKCHGKTAEGRHFGGPALISAKTASASADDLHNIIANGKGHMPKFTGKISPEEIDSLVAQIQSLNKK